MMILIINTCWLLPMACLAMVAPNLEILIFAISWLPLVWMAYRLGAGVPGKHIIPDESQD